MHVTFLRWEEIGGLVEATNSHALVDRMALRETGHVGNLHRWQVIDDSQEWYRTFANRDQAAYCLEGFTK